MNNDIINYVRSTNGKKIIIMTGDRQSFRCRQRNKIGKKTPLKFVSFKTMKKEIQKKNKIDKNGCSEILIGPTNFYTLSKL